MLYKTKIADNHLAFDEQKFVFLIFIKVSNKITQPPAVYALIKQILYLAIFFLLTIDNKTKTKLHKYKPFAIYSNKIFLFVLFLVCCHRVIHAINSLHIYSLYNTCIMCVLCCVYFSYISDINKMKANEKHFTFLLDKSHLPENI